MIQMMIMTKYIQTHMIVLKKHHPVVSLFMLQHACQFQAQAFPVIADHAPDYQTPVRAPHLPWANVNPIWRSPTVQSA